MIKKYTLLIFYLFCAISLLSQSNNVAHYNFKVKYFTIEDGLSNNKVSAICKDKYGFMWFGTSEGLNKWDGYKTIIYKNDILDSSSISSNSIRAICKLSDGRLWVGTDAGLNIYNPDIDGFIRVDFDNNNNKLEYIRNLYEDKNGVLWITTIHGLFFKEKGNTTISAFKEINNLYGYPDINSAYLDSKDNLWLGTRINGLLLYNFNTKETQQFINVPGDNTTISGNWIQTICEDKTGNLWFGTYNNGLNRFNSATSTFSQIVIDDKLSKSERIKDIVEDKHGQLWVATKSGLHLKESENSGFTRFAHTDNAYTRLSQNSISDIYIDDMNIMWLATYAGGVNYIDMDQKKFNHYFSKSDNNDYLNSAIVYTIYEDSKNDLWIGTENGGVNYYNQSTKKFEYFINNPQNPNSLSGNNVKAIIEDNRGNMWIGTYNKGLNYYNIKTKTFTHYRAKDLPPLSLHNDNINDLLLDSEGNFWIATNGGVDLWPKGKNEIIHLGSKGIGESMFDRDKAFVVFEDSHKNIWVGTDNHVLLLFNKTDSTFAIIKGDLINTNVHSIFEDNKKQLWVGGSEGLYYLNLQNDSVIHYTEKDGLPATTVYKTFDDNAGNLWISTPAGLSKFKNAVNTPHIPNFRNYHTHDGLQSIQFVYNSNDTSRSGKLYFGGINGFNSFYPEEIKDNPYKATVVITGLKIFNKDVAVGEEVKGKTALEKPIFKTEELVLSYKHYVFSLQFAALHYALPSNNQYAYRLEGFDPKDSDWNYTNAENRSATYTNLNGGEYIFKVKASNSDGVWNEVPTLLKIRILPPFWKTFWFRSLSVLAIILIVLGFYSYRISSLRKQKHLLQQKVKERTKEIAAKNSILLKQADDLNEVNTRLEENQQRVIEQSEELRAQRDELSQANEILVKLNATKDQLFSIIAHDLKNPFTSLLGFSEILKSKYEGMDDAKRKRLVNVIFTSAQNIFKLLENLLFWARSQSGNLDVFPEEFSVSDLIESNIALIENMAKAKNLEIKTVLSEDILLIADRNMISTVVRNLLTNAIKFTEKGTISIEVEKTTSNVKFKIIDTGLGIGEERAKTIFEVDRSKSTEGTKGESGTGLGLIICKEFIEKNKGSIGIESKLGEGSTFYFILPV